MKYKPHDYQKYATDFIIQNPVSALFLEMGLGKSVITLSAIWELMLDYFLVSKVLVIAPLRVARDTWPAEIKKWDHLRGLSYSVVIGSEKERVQALMAKAQIYLINRENVKWLIDNYRFTYDMVIIDELSSFKNHQAQRFKALRKVRPFVTRVVGLTGTPAPNGLMDLWAEIGILDMGARLGRFIGAFREHYFTPDKRNQNVIFSYKPKVDAENAIYEKIKDIAISMKNMDHIKMPECVYSSVIIKMDQKETKYYEQLKKDMFLPFEDGEIDAVNAAALSNKLIQMANGAVYMDGEKYMAIHDRKLDALEDLIEAANGKPVLVAYWYKHDLERIQERFPDAVRLDKKEQFESWNKGEIPVALIHPASAGHGLNLQTGGSTIIWFSLTWSLELYQQTNARLHRQGQKETVVIEHIINRGTIDEDVMLALQRKDKTQEALIDAVKANMRKEAQI
jgi:SNF2 family DNA or RNA helicase